MAKRKGKDNTMAKRKGKDNTMAKWKWKDNTMAKRNGQEGQTMIYKTRSHIKLKIVEHAVKI
jgi:hypothetical protein